MGTYPYVSSQHDGGGVHDSAVSGIEVMVERGKHHVVPDQATVAQRDTSVVLEMATGVDEHVFANGDVFPEIRIEWRERLECFVHGAADQARKQFTQFRLAMVSVVDFASDVPGLVAHLVHETVDVGRVEGKACIRML